MKAGPRTPSLPSGIPLGLLAILPILTEARSPDRGSLSIHTTPDSAIVVLDGSQEGEREKTPYLNESMIPGPHSIQLIPRNPSLRSATYKVRIEAGQVAEIVHQFEYRTKSHGFEHLSIAPWRMAISTGLDFRRAIGFEGSTSTASGEPSRPSSDYPGDSTPSSLAIPFDLRIGFPWGIEGHFHLPSARRTLADGSSGGLAMGDVSLGLKWTSARVNSAIDLAWDFGNSTADHLADGLSALQLGLITDQRWKWIDLSAEARYHLRLAGEGPITPGDVASATIRPGVPLAQDRILPYVALRADYAFADQHSGVDLGNESYVLTAIPGMIWYAGRSTSLEFGIPLSLLASNAETSWGISASINLGRGFAPPPSRTRKAPSAVAQRPDGVLPPQGSAFVLFDSHETTNAEYAEFCRKTGRELPLDPEIPGMPGYASDPRYGSFPVVNVSLEDARAFAKWKDKRLPTVAEWMREYAEVQLSTDQVACGLEAPESAQSRRQGLGNFHAAGNVAEWVEDDRGNSAAAHHAGGFFSLPAERCVEKGRWIDISAPSGAKYIGIRLVTEVR